MKKLSRKKRRLLKMKDAQMKKLNSANEIPRKKKRRKEYMCLHNRLLIFLYPADARPIWDIRKALEELRRLESRTNNDLVKSCVQKNQRGEYVCQICGEKLTKAQNDMINSMVEHYNIASEREAMKNNKMT